MNEVEPSHDEGEGEDEVHFREDDPRPDNTSQMTWMIKFEQLSRCLREVQLASEQASSEMFRMTKDGRSREELQERRIEAMHVGITDFLERCDPRTSQLRAPLMHQLRVRRLRRPRRQGYRPDYVWIANSNHLLSIRTCRLHLRAARIRASGITTTLGTCASEYTTTLGTRAPGITTTLETRATGIMTTLGTRTSGNTTTIDPMNGLHMRTTEEIAATHSETHTIVG